VVASYAQADGLARESGAARLFVPADAGGHGAPARGPAGANAVMPASGAPAASMVPAPGRSRMSADAGSVS